MITGDAFYMLNSYLHLEVVQYGLMDEEDG